MATPTPEAKKRGAVGDGHPSRLVGAQGDACRALLFLHPHRVEETFSSSGVAKYQDIGGTPLGRPSRP